MGPPGTDTHHREDIKAPGSPPPSDIRNNCPRGPYYGALQTHRQRRRQTWLFRLRHPPSFPSTRSDLQKTKSLTSNGDLIRHGYYLFFKRQEGEANRPHSTKTIAPSLEKCCQQENGGHTEVKATEHRYVTRLKGCMQIPLSDQRGSEREIFVGVSYRHTSALKTPLLGSPGPITTANSYLCHSSSPVPEILDWLTCFMIGWDNGIWSQYGNH